MLEIKKYPDPILRQKCEEVKEITEEITQLIEKMEKKMVEEDGVGLAANQVGVAKRIIIVLTERGPEAFINPKILRKSQETEISEEGCLSIPGIPLNIKRAREVSVQAQDSDGKAVQVEAKELSARIFQHEIDHIDGILIINRISFFERLKIKRKIKGI